MDLFIIEVSLTFRYIKLIVSLQILMETVLEVLCINKFGFHAVHRCFFCCHLLLVFETPFSSVMTRLVSHNVVTRQCVSRQVLVTGCLSLLEDI
jgi:hypothetical protein